MTDTMSGDDDADLVLDDDEGAMPVATPTRTAGDAGPIAEDDRVIPPTADPAIVHRELASHVYVRAHHNLPGWGLVACRKDADGNVIDDDGSLGFIPNNEEGVRAVELGFAELTEPPAGVEPPGR